MCARVGMIGLGVISRFYLRGIPYVPNLELAGVCDLDEGRMNPYRVLGVPAYTDYRVMLRRPDIDGVVINLPNHLHFRVALEALAAGKHVCCEKPMTLSPHEAQVLCTFAANRQRAMITAFHRRHNRNFTKGLAGLSKGPRIARVRARYLERIEDHSGDDGWYLRPDQCGGGCLADNGPNVFDSLMRFLGSLRVVRSSIQWDARGFDREARVELGNASEVTVQVQLDWAYPDGECKDFTIHLVDGTCKHIDLLEGFQVFKESLNHEYVGVWLEFVDAMRDGRIDWTAVENVGLVASAYAAEIEEQVP